MSPAMNTPGSASFAFAAHSCIFATGTGMVMIPSPHFSLSTEARKPSLPEKRT